MLGNAQVNRITGSANDGEARIEGFPNSGDPLLTTYGGGATPNNADNSGILRYVSIRFGGFEFAANNEINGLTLGGVGNGTIIENVEVISNSDDGVEFFGGTVNTKRIAVAFCQDGASTSTKATPDSTSSGSRSRTTTRRSETMAASGTAETATASASRPSRSRRSTT
ncbi:hypothetical protein HZ994_03690 [Akkermansiaceae bacterium]|nr:hypothetical protein HZ994_03690 [Akkermansiaceae bacterium]